MKRLALAGVVLLGLVASCTWPPTLPSTPANPAQAVPETVDQAAAALPAVEAPAVPRVNVPAVAVPRVSVPRTGGGLLR